MTDQEEIIITKAELDSILVLNRKTNEVKIKLLETISKIVDLDFTELKERYITTK